MGVGNLMWLIIFAVGLIWYYCLFYYKSYKKYGFFGGTLVSIIGSFTYLYACYWMLYGVAYCFDLVLDNGSGTYTNIRSYFNLTQYF